MTYGAKFNAVASAYIFWNINFCNSCYLFSPGFIALSVSIWSLSSSSAWIPTSSMPSSSTSSSWAIYYFSGSITLLSVLLSSFFESLLSIFLGSADLMLCNYYLFIFLECILSINLDCKLSLLGSFLLMDDYLSFICLLISLGLLLIFEASAEIKVPLFTWLLPLFIWAR